MYVYDNLRKTLFDNMIADLAYFKEATTMTKFKILFNARGLVAVHFARFVFNTFK